MADKTLKHFVCLRFFSFQATTYLYNILYDRFLKEQLPLTKNALASLENQTNKNFEVIFVVHPKFFENPKYEFIFSTLKANTTLPLKFIPNTPLSDMFKTPQNPALCALLKEAYDNYDFVITTSMDFDDFAFKDAVQDTQNKINECETLLAYGYNNGYQYLQDSGDLYPLYYGDFWGHLGHTTTFKSLIVKSSFAKKLPYQMAGDMPHTNIVPYLKQFLARNGVEYSENMFQQNAFDKAYIYFKHKYAWWITRAHRGRVEIEQPSVRPGIPNMNKIRLTSEDITKEELKEEFGFFYDVNLSEEDRPLQQEQQRTKVNPEIQVSATFRPYLTARLDIISRSNEGDFQILSISDENANVFKPRYLQRDGIGYQIESYAGKLVFSVKSTAKGKITLILRGMMVRNREDPSKIVPYWIDYTNLTVNEQAIFDELTPVWHNKPYRYELDVEANEVIKLRLTWLPHRSDT